jgi:hypothetical protein
VSAFGGQRTARFGRKEPFEEKIARTLSASGAEKQTFWQAMASTAPAAPLLIRAEGPETMIPGLDDAKQLK